MDKIIFNGVEYADMGAMPPEVRVRFQQIMANPDKVVQQVIELNGRNYSSVAEMPPDDRKLYEDAMRMTGKQKQKIAVDFKISAGTNMGRPSGIVALVLAFSALAALAWFFRDWLGK